MFGTKTGIFVRSKFEPEKDQAALVTFKYGPVENGDRRCNVQWTFHVRQLLLYSFH